MGGEAANNQYAESQNPKRVFGYLLVILVALVMADGLITRFLITNGLATESNPFLRSLVNSDRLLVIKLSGSILCAYLLWYIYKRKPRISRVVATVCVLSYTGILYWNLFVCFVAAY